MRVELLIMMNKQGCEIWMNGESVMINGGRWADVTHGGDGMILVVNCNSMGMVSMGDCMTNDWGCVMLMNMRGVVGMRNG